MFSGRSYNCSVRAGEPVVEDGHVGADDEPGDVERSVCGVLAADDLENGRASRDSLTVTRLALQDCARAGRPGSFAPGRYSPDSIDLRADRVGDPQLLRQDHLLRASPASTTRSCTAAGTSGPARRPHARAAAGPGPAGPGTGHDGHEPPRSGSIASAHRLQPPGAWSRFSYGAGRRASWDGSSVRGVPAWLAGSSGGCDGSGWCGSRASRLTRSPGVRVMPGSGSRRARLSMTLTGIHSCGQVRSPSALPTAGEPAGMVISRIW